MRERSALRELQLEAARWEAVLATARDAIISIDEAGLITLFNKAAEEIFGYEASEVLGKNVSLLMPSPYREEHASYLERYHATGVPEAIGKIRHVEALRKNGEIFPMELSVSESRVGDDVLYSAIIRDVTERRRLERERDEAQRLAVQRARLADVGALAAKIVHDVGNPLAGLTMSAENVKRRLRQQGSASSERIGRGIDRILTTANRLSGLIAEFKDFLREQDLELSRIRLPDFLEELVSAWQDEADSRGIILLLDTADDVPELRADGAKLHRVLDNLIKNAMEAIDHGPGEVRLSADLLNDEKVCICVEDSGPGLPEGVDVFKLFETTKANGSGLGLPIAQQIAAAHGGGLEFASVEPHGTRFVVELPLARATSVS